MQAIILAAGMGTRLKDLTKNNTKCMIKVNGVTLIDRMLHQIEKNNVDRIVIVAGYKKDILIDYINSLNISTPITYVENPIYDKTNNIYSLFLARDYLVQDDTLLFESDLIFEDKLISMLLEDERPSLALVDKYESWMDGTCVKIDSQDNIDAFIPGSKFKYEDKDKYYKTVNIYKFSKNFSQNYYVPFLEAYSKALGNNEYYEQVLRVITMLEASELKAKRLDGEKWYEIDDVQDLDIATTIFTNSDEEKVAMMERRFGGYWRYPKMLDFCYLVNPYFPNQKLIDEIKANFEKLLTQYPSGMEVNSLIAAKDFDIRSENVVVGNGASELIKVLLEKVITGKIGIIKPTFEEYPNRYDGESIVSYDTTEKGYRYNENDLMEFFGDKDIESLVLINPDNPSGNYISKDGVLRMISWANEKGIKLIVDESFVDFADEENATLINEEIIDNNNNLYIIKSISKSFGVPGLRLGILVSGNTEMISTLKKEVSIWNINSFAEFYLQIYEKYKKAYKDGMNKFREERHRFYNELKQIEGIRVIESQANYFMIETYSISSRQLIDRLLIDYNIFAKDLSKKLGKENYIRIAIRNTEENNKLLEAIKNIIK